jgi:hypothetical protein
MWKAFDLSDLRLPRRALVLAIILTSIVSVPLVSRGTSGAEVDIVTRIDKGTDWILEQVVEYQRGRYAFARGVAESNGARVYLEDNARVAWALANYHKDLTSTRHDKWLKASVEFVLEGQTANFDFHRYYDTKREQWVGSGSFYYWNSHVMALLAQTAFTMRKLPEGSIEHTFWNRVIQRIEACIDSWTGAAMKTDGSWEIAYPEPRSVRVEDVGMMLNVLSCVSGYEKMWGDGGRAEKFSKAARKTCDWILNQQEMNQNSWGYGGYYDDQSKAIQTTLSNGRIVFGLLSFWTSIGLTVQEPDYDLLRKRMIAWTDGFVVKITDQYGGPAANRTELLTSLYPKRTLVAAEFIRDLMLIWVDLGGSYYWSLTELTYNWLVGKNEMQRDMQQMNEPMGRKGSFCSGMQNSTYVDLESTTETTAECVEAMLHAMTIDIPEFPHFKYPVASTIVAAATLLIILTRRRRTT